MKKIFGVAGIVGGLAISYKIGKIVGIIETGKTVLDVFEEEIPGLKRKMAEIIADRAIDKIFDSKEYTSKD